MITSTFEGSVLLALPGCMLKSFEVLTNVVRLVFDVSTNVVRFVYLRC